MNKCINISDLSKLKIKKIKDYKIIFSYEDKEFILMNFLSEDSTGIKLLTRKKVKQDRYVVEEIASKETLREVLDTVKDISKVKCKNITYSNVDREHFVKILTELGFIEGKYKEEFDKVKEEWAKLQEDIRGLQHKISKLCADWRATPGVGSKQYGYELKARVAERVKGAKEGDYCEEYDDYYGNKHPEYGGKLVDLFSLPVGERFYVCNGGYVAYIGVNKHGDKTVVTPETENVITKDFHSLYIE